MRFFTKKTVVVPESNATREVESVRIWTVTWQARKGKWSTDVEKQYEAFTSQEEALKFADSLRQAFKLIRHTDETHVEVSAN